MRLKTRSWNRVPWQGPARDQGSEKMKAWFASVATGAVMAMAPVMASAQTGPALAEARASTQVAAQAEH